MALAERGAVVGSVSGGCIEDDLIAKRATREALDGPPQLVKYGVSADEAHRFGLPCGGTLELLLEFNPDVGVLARLVASLEQGRLVRRTTRLADGHVTLQGAGAPEDLRIEALATDAFYVGAIGSRRNTAARRERLREHFDIAQEALDRLRGPVGLYIGSKTPPEIAVSIMADVIATKNGVALPPSVAVGRAKDAAAVPQDA
jgi:xanthine/CO dehydrogenase XdhC/CoxF family maturation factor